MNRGPTPIKKPDYTTDFELVAFKHTEFRKVENPPVEKLLAYEDAMEQLIWKFMRSNVQLCSDHLLAFDDLKTYALVWTVNYIGLYEIRETRGEEENIKLYKTYLQQRFSAELRGTLKKKERSVLPSLDEAYIGMRGRTYDYGNKGVWEGDEVLPEEEEDIDPEGKMGYTFDPAKKKAEAARELTERLEQLPHDEMVSVLLMMAENNRIPTEANHEAARRMKEHAAKCKDCKDIVVPGDDRAIVTPKNVPIQDENGTVYADVAAAATALGLVRSNIRAVLGGRYKHTGGHTFKYLPQEDEQGAGALSSGAAE
jgi:hypothetical protein